MSLPLAKRPSLGQQSAFTDEFGYRSMSDPMEVLVFVLNSQLVSEEHVIPVVLEEGLESLSCLNLVAVRPPRQVWLRISEVIPISHVGSVYCDQVAA